MKCMDTMFFLIFSNSWKIAIPKGFSVDFFTKSNADHVISGNFAKRIYKKNKNEQDENRAFNYNHKLLNVVRKDALCPLIKYKCVALIRDKILKFYEV